MMDLSFASSPGSTASDAQPKAELSISARLFALPTLIAMLSTGAMVVALIGQGYLQRRILVADAVFLFIWAILLFIVAFPDAPQKVQSSIWTGLLRGSLVILAVLVFLKVWQNFQQGRDYVFTVALAFLPLVLLGTALAGERKTSQRDEENIPEAATKRLATGARFWRLPGFLLLSGLGLAVIATIYWFKHGHSNEAFFINSLSLVFIFAAVYRLEIGRATTQTRFTSDAPRPLVEAVIVLAILIIGGFLRTWQLTTIPYGVWFDEGQTGLEALRILKGIPFTPMGTFQAANPSLFFYITAFAFKLLGPTLLAVRLVQASTGLLTVVAFYILLRYTLGWRTAVVGAFFLAVSSWHVNWSRFGMPYSIGAPLFEIITAYLLLRALHIGRLTTFTWAGLSFGLGLYTYFGFRLFPFVLLGYVVYGFIFNKDNVRRSIAGLVLFGLVTCVTVLPQASWAWQNRQDFMVRMSQTSVFAGKNTPQERMAALTNSLRRHVMMLNYIGDGNGRHGIPGAPALDAISAALFVIGLGYCLYRWRSPTYALLALWFVVTMQAGILSLDWEAPQQHRTLVAIPAIYGMVALVVGKAWQAWENSIAALPTPLARCIGKAILLVLLIVFAGVVGWINYDRYFNQQMKRSDVFYSFSTIETAVARRVAELGPTANRYYIQVQGSPVFNFLVGGDTPDRPVDTVFFRSYAHMPLREQITKTAVFLLEPWRVTIEPADVLRYYPHAQFVDHKDPFGKTMVFEFRVPPEDVNNLLGLMGRYYAGDEPQGEPVLQRVDKSIAFDWGSDSPVPGSFNVEWSGSLVPAEAGVHVFHVIGDGEVRMSLDGQMLDIGPHKPPVSVDLAKGQHPIILWFKGTQITLLWTPPNGKTEPIPTSALIAVGWPEHGLVGRYYRGESWQGRPEFVQVDPYLAFRWHPDPIEPGPWSATWTGKIEIATSGQYIFQGVSNDRFWLIIDGRTYLNGTRGVNEVAIELAAGQHDIEVKYANNRGYSELRLSWRPPNGPFEVVPNSVLYVK